MMESRDLPSDIFTSCFDEMWSSSVCMQGMTDDGITGSSQ